MPVFAAATFYAWKYVPATPADRLAFNTVIRSTTNPPFLIAGEGTQPSPWSLRTVSSTRKLQPSRAFPVAISLDDDRERVFQSSPPSALDVAVILQNLKRLGAEKPVITSLLAWEKPEAVGLRALDFALESFTSVVTAAPLSRTATSSPLPASFRRASVPLSSLRGDRSTLATVNQLAVGNTVLGTDNATSGFSFLEGEAESSNASPVLLARWEDRVVLHVALLAVMQSRSLPIEGVEIQVGEFISLSPAGPVIPIDHFGRLAATPIPAQDGKKFSASSLIDRAELLPVAAQQVLILRDDQATSDPSTRAFSQHICSLIDTVSSENGLTPQQVFVRMPPGVELWVLAAVMLALSSFLMFSSFTRNLCFGLMAVACLTAQWLAASWLSIWLPCLAALTGIASAAVLAKLFFSPGPVADREVKDPENLS